MISSLAAIPVVFVFVTIGQLLYLLYERPELMASANGGELMPEFNGESITVFMSYILSEMPSGVRGLAAAGIVAAAISTMNSGLNAMSSVLIGDFYRPWRESVASQGPGHYVFAGRLGMVLFALLLSAMAVLCFYWQRYTDMALLEFALAVMSFSYAGLIAVFLTAVFTGRGSSVSVIAALIAGFATILLQQSYIVDSIGLPTYMKSLSFPWQLLIGVGVSIMVCAAGATQKEHG